MKRPPSSLAHLVPRPPPDPPYDRLPRLSVSPLHLTRSTAPGLPAPYPTGPARHSPFPPTVAPLPHPTRGSLRSPHPRSLRSLPSPVPPRVDGRRVVRRRRRWAVAAHAHTGPSSRGIAPEPGRGNGSEPRAVPCPYVGSLPFPSLRFPGRSLLPFQPTHLTPPREAEVNGVNDREALATLTPASGGYG